MPLPITPASLNRFYRFLPNPEAITFYRLQAGETFAPALTVATARQRPITNDDLQVFGNIILGEDFCLWSLWNRGEFASFDPKEGDVVEQIVSGGTAIAPSYLLANGSDYLLAGDDLLILVVPGTAASASGTRWKIRRVKKTIMGNLYSCLCQKEVQIT